MMFFSSLWPFAEQNPLRSNWKCPLFLLYDILSPQTLSVKKDRTVAIQMFFPNLLVSGLSLSQVVKIGQTSWRKWRELIRNKTRFEGKMYFLCSESKHKRSDFDVQITYSLNLFYSQSYVLSLMSIQERKKRAMTPYLHGSRQNKRQHSLKLSQGNAGQRGRHVHWQCDIDADSRKAFQSSANLSATVWVDCSEWTGVLSSLQSRSFKSGKRWRKKKKKDFSQETERGMRV